ncbi:toprim domain-containing protein [Rhizobium sp. SGZ-381]|uniref:toprim domain-containing protein n=1 Tax=Rhizobium sp. SGZ-381 TaxID=3342800 RepID=UPI0036703202
MTRSDLPEIKQMLQDQIQSLCANLLPDGKPQGRLWVAHNPVTGDYSQTPEFKVALTRDVGAWKDWRTGEAGDVLGLIGYINFSGQKNVRPALDWARDFLNLRSMPAEARREVSQRARQAREDAAEREARSRLDRMARAEKLFFRGMADGAGSAPEAFGRRYFAARRVPLERIANRDLQTFRFAGSQEFWARAQFRHENGRPVKVHPGPEYPCIYAAGRLANGQLSGIHMTYLDPMAPKKLPVAPKKESAKVMWGPWEGAVIRLSHGPEGEPPETACQAHPLIIGEGIETTASVAIVAPEARAWAGGSLANMKNAPFWLPCISTVFLLKDFFKSDTTKQQFAQVVAAVEAAGKPWVEMDPPDGDGDFNDTMMEG